jgi:hypothetical protein
MNPEASIGEAAFALGPIEAGSDRGVSSLRDLSRPRELDESIDGSFPMTTAWNILLIGFAILVVVSDRMWQKLQKDDPAVCVVRYTSGEEVQ